MPDILLNKWANVLGQCAHIPTWTEPLTLAYLAELASKSEVAVEFGVYLGASAKVMLTANPKLHLWCVDIFTAFAFNREVAKYFLKEEIAQGRCELITGDSQRALEMLPHQMGNVDMVWVDDGHAEEDVLRDIRCGLALLKSGGVMVGHDFDFPHNDVARGVIRSGIKYDLPVPRLWRHVKP